MTMYFNDGYGGFIVSKNITSGHSRISNAYREKREHPEENGWILYSEMDDEDYVSDGCNFTLLNMQQLYEIESLMWFLKDAPYGTDLAWMYEGDEIQGLWDLVAEKEVKINEVIGDEEWEKLAHRFDEPDES